MKKLITVLTCGLVAIFALDQYLTIKLPHKTQCDVLIAEVQNLLVIAHKTKDNNDLNKAMLAIDQMHAICGVKK